jgi:hypothetical protein
MLSKTGTIIPVVAQNVSGTASSVMAEQDERVSARAVQRRHLVRYEKHKWAAARKI